ncbi:MAG TPA: hypothetical protein VF245_10970 [Solirubrobacterales bacterium]
MSRRHATGLVAIVVVAAIAALALPGSGPSDAAFPGIDGRIAYSSGDSYSYSSAAIWSSNADGGSPTVLSAGPGVSAPSYSADGSGIAFDRESGIATMSSAGTGVAQLLTGSSWQSSSTEWRKDYEDPHSGKTIPVVRIQSYVYEWQNFDHPSFSPNGAQLVVAEAAGKRTNSSICAVEAVNEQTCLGWGNPNAYFNYENDCNGCGSHLISIDASTGVRLDALTSLANGRRDTKPTYSADGKIAFARSNEGNSSIFVLDSPGAAPRRVTNGQSDRAPDFSPNGSQIVFSHAYSDIGIVGTGGGAVQLVPIPAPSEGWGGYVNSPVFSPDGSRIAFRRGVYGPGGQDGTGLFTVASDGSGFTRIAADGYAPSWQPQPPPPPPGARPKAKAKKGKVRLNGKGRAAIGTIVCGGTPCKLEVLSARLKVGKRSCRQVRTRLARKLGAGKTARFGIKVYGKCLAALEEAGKGRLVVRVRATDALGKRGLTLKATLVPPKGRRGKSHG